MANQGKLFIVGTPIGNLGDLSPRAVEAFRAADAVCCEDTRVTGKLLSAAGVSRQLIRCDENVIAGRAPSLVDRMLAGETLAFASDAGMPGVSDPGQVLVDAAREAGVPVEVVPGPVACVTALVASGIPCDHFFFEGFLPRKAGERVRRLQQLMTVPGALLFYESPHRVTATLESVASVFPTRVAALCRELTKLHEDIWKTTLGEAVEHYKTNEPRGEYVLVMAGAPETADPEQELTLEQAAQRALELTGQGFGPTAAAKAAAQGTPYSKSEVYKQLLVLQQGQQAGE